MLLIFDIMAQTLLPKLITACYSPIQSTVTPPITSAVCLSTTSVSWSTRTTPDIPSYNGVNSNATLELH